MSVLACIRFVVLVLTASLLFACGAATDRPVVQTVVDTVAPATPAMPAMAMSRLTFGRAGCLGRCQGYQIELTAAGEYNLVTSASSEPLRGQLASSTVAELQSLYQRVRALQLPERLTNTNDCPRFQTDMPTVSIGWQSSQLRWQLQHNAGCKGFDGESQLLMLESRIEALLPKPATGSER